MMDLAELQERFAIPGVLGFEQAAAGLVVAQVTAPAAQATVYLQGAHLTHWKPEGLAPVLFLSARSELAPGKAIRGGVPVIFPWFGPRHDGKAGPQHGFARTAVWDLAFAAVAGDDVHLTFTLAPTQVSRELGFGDLRLAYRMAIGRRLTLELTVANDSAAAVQIEEALHTYFAVGDVRSATVEGLGGTEYIDKRDEMRRKPEPAGAMTLTGTTDRVYLNTTATCTIGDGAGGRKIVVEKSGSRSTVVWNPWAELAATMADMEPDGWRTMLCVETANVGEDAVTLEPGKAHTMRVEISTEALN
jgi:glucose-6-phosphate 1-epimerase